MDDNEYSAKPWHDEPVRLPTPATTDQSFQVLPVRDSRFCLYNYADSSICAAMAPSSTLLRGC